jgi:hypothetical protein
LKPLWFKQLLQGGNILVIGINLEAAQVLGAGDLLLPTNESEYSGIHANEPEEIVQYFIRA